MIYDDTCFLFIYYACDPNDIHNVALDYAFINKRINQVVFMIYIFSFIFHLLAENFIHELLNT